MKKQFIAICFAVTALALSSCTQELVLKRVEIPGNIKVYLTSHFPNQTIVQAIKNIGIVEITYEVILNDMTKLQFNQKNEIIDIDAISMLPNSVIPEKLLAYVNSNYPSSVITAWQLEDKQQGVKLDDGLELKFMINGEFISVEN